MTTLNDREHGQEEMFHHGEEFMFKALARRNKYFGLWVAEQLQLSSEAAQDYAQKMVLVDLEDAGDAAVIKRAVTDFSQAGLEISEARIVKELGKFLQQAKKEMMSL